MGQKRASISSFPEEEFKI